MESDAIMGSDENRLIIIYRRLLDIAEKEQVEIAQNNFDRVEQYCMLKDQLIKEMEALKDSELRVSTPKQCAELESLIKKIITVNNANAEAVLNMKNRVMNELYDLKGRRTVVKAYNNHSQY